MKRGEETTKAFKNFPFSGPRVNLGYIYRIAQIKKAAARANFLEGGLARDIMQAILGAADEILASKYDPEFMLPALQGGAGTATHMCVNEVIANRATEILKNKIKVHPINHVNMSQSTNDVCPSALKIESLKLLQILERNLIALIGTLDHKAKEFKNIRKLARTHLQDAVPTTLGAEFAAYADNLAEHLPRIKRAEELCRTLNLGGTAVGNSINASSKYIKEVYKELNNIKTGNKFRPAKNLIAKTGGQADFLVISEIITALSVDLSKMANDLRLLSSGPRGGFGEIILPELQKGSSIMPGKVNPVLPETLNQLYMLVSGNNLSIERAVEASQLELGVMFPLIADRLLQTATLASEVIREFDHACLRGIKADAKKCREHLENSTAYATLLSPKLGYDIVGEIVKKAVRKGLTLREVAVGEKYISETEFNRITSNF